MEFLSKTYLETLSGLEKNYEKAMLQYEKEIIHLQNAKEEELAALESEPDPANDYNSLLDLYENIKTLLQTGQVLAPCDGTIKEIQIKEHSYYQGLSELFSIIPVNSSIRYQADISNFDKSYFENLESAVLLLRNDQIEVEILGITEENGKTYLLFEPSSYLTREQTKEIQSLLITKESSFYDAIIPCRALIGEHVYVLREEDRAFWGKAYYVEKVSVKAGMANMNEVGIEMGLSQGDKVVVSWDRELKDKQRVVLELP